MRDLADYERRDTAVSLAQSIIADKPHDMYIADADVLLAAILLELVELNDKT